MKLRSTMSVAVYWMLCISAPAMLGDADDIGIFNGVSGGGAVLYPPQSGLTQWLVGRGSLTEYSDGEMSRKAGGTPVYYLAQSLGHNGICEYEEVGGTTNSFEPGTNNLVVEWTGEVLESTAAYRTLVGKADLNAAGGWALMQDIGEIKLWMYDADDPGKYRWIKPTTPVSAGVREISFSKSGTNVQLYVDGVEITSLTEGGDASGIPANIEASGFTLLVGAGRHGGSKNYYTPHTMLHLKVQSGSDVFETHFSEGAGTTLYCVAGSGLTATLYQSVGVEVRWDNHLEGDPWNIRKGYKLSGGVQIPSLADGSGPVGGGDLTNDGGFLHNGSSDKLYVGEEKTYSSTVVEFYAEGYTSWNGDYDQVTAVLWEAVSEFTLSYEYNEVEETDLWQGFEDGEPPVLVWVDWDSNGHNDPTGEYEHETETDIATVEFKQNPYSYPEWDGPDGRAYTYLAANNGDSDLIRTIYDANGNMLELLWYRPVLTGGMLAHLNTYLENM